MGKRTRFQQKEISQLILQVHRESATGAECAGDTPMTTVDKEKENLPNVSSNVFPVSALLCQS